MIVLGSQRARLAAVIFTLAGILVSLLLLTLAAVLQSGQKQRVQAREDVFVDLVAAVCRRALLTNEYAEAQLFAESLLHDSAVKKVVLADYRSRIMVSTAMADIGEPFAPEQLTAPNWRQATIANPTGTMGTLAILFSRDELAAVAREFRKTATLLALPILLAIAGIAWLLGSLLARRLELLTSAVQQVAGGDLDTQVGETGSDEIGRLGLMFNTMTGSLRQFFAALKETKARLNEAQQIAHIGSWELNCVTHSLEWSPEVYRLFELDPAQFAVSYEAFLAAIHPDDRALVQAAYTASVRDKTSYITVFRLLMADGRIRFLEDQAQTFYDPDGTPLRSVGTLQDITAARQREEELQRVNEELQTINRIITTTTTTSTTTAGVNEILEKVLDEALALSGLEGGTICMIGSDDRLVLSAHRQTSAATFADLSNNIVKVGECLCGECARDHKPLILKNREQVLAFSSREAQRGEDIRYHAAFPLMIGSRCLGVLCVFTRTNATVSERQLALLEAVSSQIAIAVDNARMFEEISRQAAILEEKVKERTADLEKSQRALQLLLEDMEESQQKLKRLNKHFVGRELRMRELKEQIAWLEKGRPGTVRS